ncbi:non-ribosomal peptide synthetase [Streptomyces venezuelae]|uniref:non-ribosomal peptide synthetase n=1 Tax=Streptomyces venezuelae TaxID=54571 RepID=UPI001685A4A3|nr:non-ribosomal peptide synthetase [Streptomyces venezuelae]
MSGEQEATGAFRELTDLLRAVEDARIRLTAEDGELRVSAAKGALTAQLRDRLVDHKPGLLAHLGAQARAAAPVPALPRDGRTFPLSPGQEALWVLDQLEGHRPTYVISGVIRLEGPLRPEVLVSCLSQVANRHEALRTAFRTGDDGTPRQVVLDPAPLDVARVDLTELPPEEREKELAAVARAAGRERFDLAAGRLLRAVLVTAAPEEAYLVLALHHIAADAASLAVLFRELFVLYDADAEPSALAPLSLHYADVSAWQRDVLSPLDEHRQLAYWKAQLADAPPLLELPADRPRPLHPSFEGDTVDFVLDAPTTARLAEVAARARVTPYTVLLTCWAAVLARCGRSDEVVVGTPVGNRDQPQAASLVGFFVKTLPLRVDLTAAASFEELLGHVQRTFLEGVDHLDVPFQRIVAETAPQRSLSHTPVFQAMLTYFESPLADTETGGVTVSRADVHNGTAKFDLTLFAEHRGDSVACSLEYARDLFDPATARGLADAFRHLLGSALDSPGSDVARLPLLTPAGRQRAVEAGLGADRPLDLDRPVHRYVTEQAALRPDAVAVSRADQSLTYARLDEDSSRLAALLRDRGVDRGTLVGLHAQRTPRQLVAVLAVMKAGAAFLPLDPDHPAERTRQMLDEARPDIVLSDAPLDVGADREATLLRLDELDLSAVPADAPLPTTDRDDLIYVIYTSGSTGKPKGIAMRHGAITNLLAWQTKAFPFAPDDRVLQFSPLHFDICMMEMFGTWAAGGTVVLVDAETRRDAMRLLPYVRETGITRLFLPYVALQQLAEVARARDGRWPTELREVFSAGEQLQVTEELRDFFRHTGAVLHNQYGPSEAHVITSYTLSGTPDTWEHLPPVGTAVDNVRIRVLDPHGAPVPQGVPGEVHVAGPCLARGYLHRPDLTDQAFVPDPCTAGERMYRTGDLARWRADGTLEHLGRVDHQVKVRGFRVEPGEVTAVLLGHPALREAVVEARGSGADRALMAWVVADGAAPSAAELRRHCLDRLPEYMVPTVFVPLDALPLTVAGKVARSLLPEPERAPVTGREPGTALEKSVAAVFADVLGVERVGCDDDFFQSGGHSLAATRAALRLSEEHGVDVTARTVFARPTVAALAENLEVLLWASAPPVPAGADEEWEEGEL